MRIDSNSSNRSFLKNIHDNSTAVAGSAEKLSSGFRINRASDDPAGLVISERLRAQISGIEQETKNIEQTMNKFDTADGYLDSMHQNLLSMRETAVAAAHEGGTSEETRQTLQMMLDQQQSNFNRDIKQASFGNQALLDGSGSAVADIRPLATLDISSREKAEQSLNEIDGHIKEVSETRGEMGASRKNDLESKRNNLSTQMSNLSSAESSIRDVDMAGEYVRFVGAQIALKSSVAMLAQGRPAPYQAMELFKP